MELIVILIVFGLLFASWLHVRLTEKDARKQLEDATFRQVNLYDRWN